MAPKATAKCDLCRIAKTKGHSRQVRKASGRVGNTQPKVVLADFRLRSPGLPCDPPDRVWNEHRKEKCIRCTKGGRECGENLTQFESDKTLRGQQRRAQALDQIPAHSLQQGRTSLEANFEPPPPTLSLQDSGDGSGLSAVPTTLLAQTNHHSGSAPWVGQRGNRGSVVENDSQLEETYELILGYQYMNHTKKTISFLEQDSTPSRVPACTQKVKGFLADNIEVLLTSLIERVDESHCDADYILIRTLEAVRRFHRLADNPEQLLKLECDILEKRIRVLRMSNAIDRTPRENSPVHITGRHFHQQSLETERNELICRLKSYSRSASPEVSPAPGSDRSDSGKGKMRKLGRLTFSKETEFLLADAKASRSLTSTSRVLAFISSNSLSRQRSQRGQENTQFPTPHRALLSSPDEQVKSLLASIDVRADSRDFSNQNLVHIAAEEGKVHLLKPGLLEQRELLDTRDAFHHTPLITAVMHGNLESCKLLIAANFDCTVRDSTGRNLLGIAIRRGHCDIAEYLIKYNNFDPDDPLGKISNPPIHDAIELDDRKACKLLIDLGASFETALGLAVEKGRTEICQLMLNLVPPTTSSAQADYSHGHNLQDNVMMDVDHETSHQCGQAHSATPVREPVSSHYAAEYVHPHQLQPSWIPQEGWQ